MYVLCLFVVLAALFITVFNSRTANNINLGDTGFADFQPPSAFGDSIQPKTEPSETKGNSRKPEKIQPATTFV